MRPRHSLQHHTTRGSKAQTSRTIQVAFWFLGLPLVTSLSVLMDNHYHLIVELALASASTL